MKKPVNLIFKIIVVILFINAVIILSKSLYRVIDLQNEQTELETEYEDLMQEQEELNAQLELTKDPEYLKAYATKEYLFTDSNSITIRIITPQTESDEDTDDDENR